MDFAQELGLLIRARYPFIYVPTVEEERVEGVVARVAKDLGQWGVYYWDFVEGMQGNPNDQGFARRNPLQALEFLEKLPPQVPALLVLRDYSRFLEDVAVGRKIRNLNRMLKAQPKSVIFLAPEVRLPLELQEMVTVLPFGLPTAAELRQELQAILQGLNQSLPPQVLEELVRSCQGLSLERMQRVVGRALALRGTLTAEDVDLVLAEKRQIIQQTGILEFCPPTVTLADIGGLDNLKLWLQRRQGAFSQAARDYGLPYPRGLLLAGLQGTGKSLTAKAIAHFWHLPLLRLDVGRLFAGLVGESESRTRQMIQLTEALAPCVLWIDEIDKAFSALDSRGDSGTTNRVFGTILTWLAEKNSPVFVVATANQIHLLPPELLRKGRFDEIFFVGLPTWEERQSILQVHLSRLRPHTWTHYDLARLAWETPDFSGAELEQAIIEAMHTGFSQGREFTTDDILEAASQMVPLARTAQEQVQLLQQWASTGKVRFASRHTSLSRRIERIEEQHYGESSA
jgi:AAA+ superfamily predicted ATPase